MVRFPISLPTAFKPRLKMCFVVATPKSSRESGHDVLPLNSLGMMRIPGDVQVDAVVEYDNNRGLSEVYNQVLDNYVAFSDYDAVCLVHDDVEILDCSICDKISSAVDRGMDLIGVAGGKGWQIPRGYDPKKMPIGWTTASKDAGMAGFVLHEHDGHVFASCYGNSPSRTLTVDGLFLCLMNKGLSLRFDKQFTFDHYDVDLCFQAWKAGMKVGVEPISLLHHSIGIGLTKPKFMDSQKMFMSKWFG